MIFGGRELDSTIINIWLILSKSFYFPGLKCYIVRFVYADSLFILIWADAVEKITVNMNGFSVLQQNFNRGDITFLTKKFWGRGKKRLKNQVLYKTHKSLEATDLSVLRQTKRRALVLSLIGKKRKFCMSVLRPNTLMTNITVSQKQ